MVHNTKHRHNITNFTLQSTWACASILQGIHMLYRQFLDEKNPETEGDLEQVNINFMYTK